VNTAAIVETLAKEFSAEVGHAQRLFDLLSAGYQAPFLARFRRAEIGPFQEGAIRRFGRRMKQLEELDRRRGTLLRTLDERKPGEGDGVMERLRRSVESCMDRFELEDLFLPLRRPEPEVQLALDRGLGELADLLCAPAPGGPRTVEEVVEDGGAEGETHFAEASPVLEVEPHASSEELAGAAEPAVQMAEEVQVAVAESDPAEAEPAEPEPEPSPTPVAHEASVPPAHAPRIEFSPDLARACAPFVNPDRGVHSDAQALEGAMRILSDRLGRNPALRGTLRRMLRKNGRLSVRPLTDEKRLGAFRALLKLQANLKQIQGHRLVALRQAQAARLIAPMITLDESLALPRVRSALCKHPRPEFESVLRVVAEQALRQRLLPMIEDDVRGGRTAALHRPPGPPDVVSPLPHTVSPRCNLS
jgi:transcriptional accessory protein Tex/SPT6